MEITTARILDKRRMLKKTNSYRLAIRVTCNRRSFLFQLDLDLTEEDFKSLARPRISKELSAIREKFISEEQRAREIIRGLGTFTFQAFREAFYKNKKLQRKRIDLLHRKVNPESMEAELIKLRSAKNEGKNRKYGKRMHDRIRANVDFASMGPVAVAFGEYITLLETQERIGTSETYFSSLSSLLKFKPGLRFEDINVKFLYEYEQWMLRKDKSYTTIGIHIRNLRAIINIQIEDGWLPQNYYPFGRRKYQIPTGANVKKALDLSEIKKLYDCQPDPQHKNEAYAKDIWFFGYFSNGINTKDIANLKYNNIDEDFIIFQRAKTKFTTRTKPKNIMIPINDEMRAIISRWGNQPCHPDKYIFPVLEPGNSPHRQRELIAGFTRLVNDWMQKIAERAGITKKVLTMTYRHSYATVLKRAGVSTEFIMEQLGHHDLHTTENYLDSFELDVKKKYAANLLAFKTLPV